MEQLGLRRYGLLAACLLVLGVSVVLAATITPWALCAVPFAVVIGGCAWAGMTLRQVLAAFHELPAQGDPGSGPAGAGP